MGLFNIVRTGLGKPARPQFDPVAIPPRFLFLLMNKRCNLRCQHCEFWKNNDDDRASYLSRERRRDVLREFHLLNPNGAVVICGGESMLDIDDYFNVSRECRRLGLTCISVVNGTRIRGPVVAERMLTEGPHEISISLNSHRPDLHDRTRGVSGAFDKAVGALRRLREARERLDSPSLIYVMGLIFDENYRELPDFYDFVLNDVKADKLKLNFLQPSFGGSETDTFFGSHHEVDPDELLDILHVCNSRFHLGFSPVWMNQVHMYFTSLRGGSDLDRGWGSAIRTREHICNSYERNIMVDHYGMARLCFAEDYRGESLRKEGDLRRFWQGANDIRAQMRTCNRFCGISHSVRRVSSTTTPAAYSRLPDPKVAET